VGRSSGDAGVEPVNYEWQVSEDGALWATVAWGNDAENTLTLTEAHVGKQIRVVASYMDSLGNLEFSTSLPTGAIANVNDAPVGTVMFSGTAAVNQTLTASNNLSEYCRLGM
jgi:hypothetical protein